MIGSNGIHTDLERRVDTYRNKPQELQQRYAMSQELIDLLALQKLTAEKKAAAQHMALQAGAGGPPPTIAQQREQEAMQLTKQEVAQQQGALLQQQQGEKQKRLQQMTDGGLGGLPAPNVATPQAMAAGGIVDMGDDEGAGYARGGEVEDLPPWFDDLLAAIQQRESANNPNAVSPKGAEGLMQVMPGTQRDPGFGVRPAADRSPEELSRVGREYAAAMYRRYGGDVDKMLAAYNWGPGNVDKFGTDPSRLPKETRDYIPAVKAEFERRTGAGGIAGLPQYAQANTGTMNDASPDGASPAEDPDVLLDRRAALAKEIRQLQGIYRPTPENRARLAELNSELSVLEPKVRAYEASQAQAARDAAFTQRIGKNRVPPPAPPNSGPPEPTAGIAAVAPPPTMPGARPDDPANMAARLPGPGGVTPREDRVGADEAGLSALISGRAGASGPAELAPADRDFRTFVKGQAADQMGRDVLAEAAAEQARANAAFGMTPEQLASRQKTLAGIEALDARRFDPERMRQEQLNRFLLGMGGRSTLGSVAQGAGAASINYQNEMEALERAALGGRGSMQDKIFEDQRAIREKAFGSRAPVMRDVEAARNQGIVSGTGMSNTDENVAAQRDSTAAQRESNQVGAQANDFARLAQARNSLQQAKTQRLRIATGDIDRQIEMLEFQRDKNGQIPPNLAPRYRELTLERRRLLNAVEDEFSQIERDIIVRMGGGAGAGSLDQWGTLNQK